MNNVKTATDSLTQGPDGVWYSEVPETISYPDMGHLESLSLQENSFWYRHRNEIIMAALERHPPASPLFDIGGGTGVVAKFLQDRGLETVLVEPGKDGAAAAKALGVRDVICGTTSSAALRQGSLATIGVFDVVEHVEDDVAFLRHLHELLVPGGMLYSTVPAYRWLWSSEDVHAGHFHRYTQSSFSRRLKSAGFELAYASYFFWLLPPPILLFRTLPSIFKRDTSSHDANKVAREHGQGRASSASMLSKLLAPEVNAVRKGRTIPFGSSILAVARKPA